MSEEMVEERNLLMCTIHGKETDIKSKMARETITETGDGELELPN